MSEPLASGGRIHTRGVEASWVKIMQTVWSRGPWLEPSGARAPPLSEKSLYFLFPFKFPLSLWSLMTICQRLNVGSNLLLPLEEIHLPCYDGCQMVHTKGDQAQKQNCISRSSVRRLINDNHTNKKKIVFLRTSLRDLHAKTKVTAFPFFPQNRGRVPSRLSAH